MSKKVRWGILGAGRIAAQFADDIQYANHAELVAIAARNLGKAHSFAERFDIDKAHGSYSALYNDANVDAIYIATPHTHHLQQTIDTVNAGKHVLCEKPFTINQVECEQVLALSKTNSSYIMEGMWTYFLPAIQKARQWIEDGRIGAIKHIKADFGYPQLPFDASRREYDTNLAGGCLLEMGIYPVAIAWYFLQSNPISMDVLVRNAPNGVEDDLTFIFDYGETTATLATSFRCKLQNWCYVIGDKGWIAIPNFWRAHECFLYELDTQVDHFDDQRKGQGFEYEIESVSKDILNGKKESTIMPLHISLKFQQHMDLIRQHF